MQITLKVTGGAELARKLSRLSDELSSKTLEWAVVSGALLVANAAKERAPYRTGNLRRSIHVGGHAAESGLANTTGTDIGGNVSRKGYAEVLVGTNVEYAARQEYGFLGTDARGRQYDQPARPYLRPAFDDNKDKVAEEIGEALRDLLTC